MDGTQPTTTLDDGATAVAQPVTDVQVPAGQPQEPAQDNAPAPSIDDTAEWLSKKGFDPSDPDFATKIAKSYREAEKLAMTKAQEASELRKTLEPAAPILPQAGLQGDPSMQEFIQDYRRDKQINAFKESHPDWSQHEQAMVSILEQTAPNGFTYSQLVNNGFMSLDAVYTMAKGSAPVDTQQIKTQAQQEVLQTLANTQRAGGATPHASETNPQAPVKDPVLEGIRSSRGQ